MVDASSGFATPVVVPDRTAAGSCMPWTKNSSAYSALRRGAGIPLPQAAQVDRGHGQHPRVPLEFYHDPAGAAERVWVMARASLRRVSDFTPWRAELRQAIYQYNALPREGRPSPFTLFLGGEPNTASSMRAAAARAPADPGTDVDTVLREGAGAIRQQAAVDGDLTRRARARSTSTKRAAPLPPTRWGTRSGSGRTSAGAPPAALTNGPAAASRRGRRAR